MKKFVVFAILCGFCMATVYSQSKDQILMETQAQRLGLSWLALVLPWLGFHLF
jgi:hypothetical protein